MQARALSSSGYLTRSSAIGLSLVLVAVLLSVPYSFKAWDDRSAFLRWRPQIQQLTQVDIYQKFNYPNPPIMALLLMPLADLPPLLGSLCWFYAKFAMTVIAFLWVFRIVETPDQPFPAWAKVTAILLSLRPIMGDLAHGNVNLFILFLVIGALYSFHRGQDMGAGIWLGLAIACKVTPALFILYFMWKRAWKTVAGCALGLALFLVVVPGLFLGMNRNLDLLTSWYGAMVKPFVMDGDVTTDHINQSLPGLVFRLGSHRPSFYDKGVPRDYSNVVDVDPRVLKWIVKGCMAAFAALILWTCRTPLPTRRGWRLAAEFSLIVLGMLLFSERTWKHHCVTLMLPFAVIAYYLTTVNPSKPIKSFLIVTLVVVTLLMSSTISGLSPSGNQAAKIAEAAGAYVWAFLLLILALTVMLRLGQFFPLAISPTPDRFSKSISKVI